MDSHGGCRRLCRLRDREVAKDGTVLLVSFCIHCFSNTGTRAAAPGPSHLPASVFGLSLTAILY